MNRIKYNINMHNNDMQLDDIGEALFKLNQKKNIIAKAIYKGYIFTTDDIKNAKSVREAQIRINKLFLNYTISSLQKMICNNSLETSNIIKLKDVSSNIALPLNDQNINSLMQEENVESIEDVLNIIRKYPCYDWQIVKKNIELIMKKISLANKRGYQPLKIYTHGYSIEKLESQDKLNYGNILLLDNPTNFNPTRFNDLKNKTIYQIKKDLAHVDATGKNYVTSTVFDYRNIGLDNINKLICAIEQYEAQILRQSYLNNKKEENIFKLNKEEKINIVNNRYVEIIRYLINNVQEEFIWSKTSEQQKKIYLSSALNLKKSDIIIKEKILDYITNYVTILEAQQIAKRNLNVLKRFIIK